MPRAPKPPTIAPLTGYLDNRSPADLMPPGAFRKRQNFIAPETNVLQRAPGFERLYETGPGSSAFFRPNADLHDQLLDLQFYYKIAENDEDDPTITVYPPAEPPCAGNLVTRTTGRQPITLLYQAKNSRGTLRSIAATESRIYALNEGAHAWRLIGDGYGKGVDDGTCPPRRFHATQNQDVVLFTNGLNDILAWRFDEQIHGCAMQAVDTIPDLITVNIRNARVIWTWNNVTFLADVTIDGSRYSNRIFWSDYQNPLSWDPSKLDSIANFHDLDDNEVIMGGAALGDYFVIVTNRKLWLMSINSGSGEPFVFTRRKPTANGEGCAFYRNTICVVHPEGHPGAASYLAYAGRDGIYSFNIFEEGPKRVDWLHLATREMFEDIDTAWCDNAIAEFNTAARSLEIFWVSRGSTTGFPLQGLRIDTTTNVVSTLDYGCTALSNWQTQPRGNLFDWLVGNGICTVASLVEKGYARVKEEVGIIVRGAPITLDSLVTTDALAYNQAYKNCNPNGTPWIAWPTVGPCSGTDPTFTTEWAFNPDKVLGNHGAISQNSFCSRVTLPNCDSCDSDFRFVGALSEDWCLKQFGGVFYREVCTNPTARGESRPFGSHETDNLYLSAVASYERRGYKSILRSGAQDFGIRHLEKVIRGLLLDILTENDSDPIKISLRVGTAGQPVDPNDPTRCKIRWFDCGERTLNCQTAYTDGKHTRPNEYMNWPTYQKGKFIYFELTIDGIGGASTMSAITQTVAVAKDNKLSTT